MQPWYKDGLKFKCTECGKCCTGFPGYVFVNDEEIQALADELNLPLDEFTKRYLRRVGNRFSLKEDPKKNYDCVFLKGKQCTVYKARPTQCRTFPWWKENLSSKEAWEETGSYCEGINHEDAPLISLPDIEKHL